MEVLKDLGIEGAYLFAGWGFTPDTDFAEIYVPRDPDLGAKILAGCEDVVAAAEKGLLPTNSNVADPEVLQRSNATLYGGISPTLPAKEFKGVRKEKMLEKLSEINEQLKQGRSSLKKIRDGHVTEEEKDIADRQRELEKEKQLILDKILEASKDNDGAFLKGKENDYTVNVSRDFGVDKSSKEFLKENYPEAYEALRQLSPKVNVNVKKRAK